MSGAYCFWCGSRLPYCQLQLWHQHLHRRCLFEALYLLNLSSGWERRRFHISCGCPADIGLQLGKNCCHCSKKGLMGECCYFFCFYISIHFRLSSLSFTFISFTISNLHLHSFSSFSPVLHFHLLYYIFYNFTKRKNVIFHITVTK